MAASLNQTKQYLSHLIKLVNPPFKIFLVRLEYVGFNCDKSCDMEEYFLTSEEIMKMFAICKWTLNNWIKNKSDFPRPIKAGRRNLWKKSEIEEYLESSRK
jgi:predicted DNA-binding transcriptional regulator AlpA